MYRQSEENLLNSNTSSTCSHNMVNFGPLTSEICWRVWGTSANFNRFRILAALLHCTLIVRGRHLYLAGRSSRWALARILVLCYFCVFGILCVLVFLGYFCLMLSVPVQLTAWKDRPRNDLLYVERDVKHLLSHSLTAPVDIIWAMMFVWRIRGKIIRSVLYCVLYDN